MSSRDFMTMLALLVVLLIAGKARSADDGAEDVLSILSSDNPVLKRGLGEDVERAAARLQSTRQTPHRADTRGHDEYNSLGIGGFGAGLVEARGLPPIYARDDQQPVQASALVGATRARAEAVLSKITPAVAACYGTPTRDGSSRHDALAVRVVLDAAGRVVMTSIVRPTRFGARGTDACVTRALEQAQFEPGLTTTTAQVGYRWHFDLAATSSHEFPSRDS